MNVTVSSRIIDGLHKKEDRYDLLFTMSGALTPDVVFNAFERSCSRFVSNNLTSDCDQVFRLTLCLDFRDLPFK